MDKLPLGMETMQFLDRASTESVQFCVAAVRAYHFRDADCRADRDCHGGLWLVGVALLMALRPDYSLRLVPAAAEIGLIYVAL